MTFDAALAERVLAQIKDHPETWEQREYRCESGLCFAGWTAVLSGQHWRNAHEDDPYLETGVHAADFAADALGLGFDSDSRAGALFHWENNLDRIERLVKHYANNPDDDSLPRSAS